MRRSFCQAIASLSVIVAVIAYSGKTAIADLIVDTIFLEAYASVSGRHGDSSSYNAHVYAYGNTTSSSTANPTDPPYTLGTPTTLGSANVFIALTTSRLTISANVNPGEVDMATTDHTNARSLADGQLAFHVTEDSPFTLVDTASGSVQNFIYLNGYNAGTGDSEQLIYPTSTVVGTMTGILHSGYSYSLVKLIDARIEYSPNFGYTDLLTGGSGDVTLTINTVPEPSSITLLGLGAMGSAIGTYRRRRTGV